MLTGVLLLSLALIFSGAGAIGTLLMGLSTIAFLLWGRSIKARIHSK